MRDKVADPGTETPLRYVTTGVGVAYGRVKLILINRNTLFIFQNHNEPPEAIRPCFLSGFLLAGKSLRPARTHYIPNRQQPESCSERPGSSKGQLSERSWSGGKLVPDGGSYASFEAVRRTAIGHRTVSSRTTGSVVTELSSLAHA